MLYNCSPPVCVHKKLFDSWYEKAQCVTTRSHIATDMEYFGRRRWRTGSATVTKLHRSWRLFVMFASVLKFIFHVADTAVHLLLLKCSMPHKALHHLLLSIKLPEYRWRRKRNCRYKLLRNNWTTFSSRRCRYQRQRRSCQPQGSCRRQSNPRWGPCTRSFRRRTSCSRCQRWHWSSFRQKMVFSPSDSTN